MPIFSIVSDRFREDALEVLAGPARVSAAQGLGAGARERGLVDLHGLHGGLLWGW